MRNILLEAEADDADYRPSDNEEPRRQESKKAKDVACERR
jgi:hypothetical protein